MAINIIYQSFVHYERSKFQAPLYAFIENELIIEKYDLLFFFNRVHTISIFYTLIK